NRLTGQAAHVVLDPTLLLDKTEWQSMQKPVSCKCKNYILYFTVVGSKTLNEFAQDLSKKTGCEIVYVGGRFLDSLFSKNNIMKNIGPEEWLYLVSNARYVVTNSFHGTAFSINLEKEFFVELSSFTNTRLINIVDMFELNDRVIINGKNINIDKKIDYVSVKYKLEIEQKQSFDYLKTMIDTIAAKT
ncbi:MAG: polysaccharide pyruvyl transferase family protein, partial [Oscillospiraceae bacterium]|nr:polysaccharide pyruvyl transferase family protein [Oscillospiraceae bacterium]